MRTVYGIDGNDAITFFTLESAEDYLIEQNPEYCSSKDATYDFCEQMIWEEDKNILFDEVNREQF